MDAQKWKNIVYHQPKEEYIEFQNFYMSFSVDMFHNLPQNHKHNKNPYDVQGLPQKLSFMF